MNSMNWKIIKSAFNNFLMIALATNVLIAGNTVPQSRFDKLKKGVNISQIKVSTQDSSKLEFHALVDLDLYKAIGISHVRMPVDPELLLLPGTQWGEFQENRVASLEEYMTTMHNFGIATVLDFHAKSSLIAKMKQKDGEGPLARQNFYNLWSKIAKRLSKFSPEMLFFEVFNEPSIYTDNGSYWYTIQKNAIAYIRPGAPNHTIIVTCDGLSEYSTLINFTPYTTDTNLIYTFHFYENTIFTHQNVSFIPGMTSIIGLPYPYTGQKNSMLEAAKTGVFANDTRKKAAIDQLLTVGYNQSIIDSQMKQVADWAQKNGLRVYVGEFGINLKDTPTQSIIDWHRDVRTAAEKYNFGWCKWDWRMGFSTFDVDNVGKFRYHKGLIDALGLNSNIPTNLASAY